MQPLGFCVNSILGYRIHVASPHSTCFLIDWIGYLVTLCKFLGPWMFCWSFIQSSHHRQPTMPWVYVLFIFRSCLLRIYLYKCTKRYFVIPRATPSGLRSTAECVYGLYPGNHGSHWCQVCEEVMVAFGNVLCRSKITAAVSVREWEAVQYLRVYLFASCRL